MKPRNAAMKTVARLRQITYRAGLRPRPGSILHSPSLHLVYAMRKVDLAEAFNEGIWKGQHHDNR